VEKEYGVKDCIFCKIINRKLPSTIIAENNDILVIQDIQPKAPIHYLIIPKNHIEDIQSLSEADAFYSSHMLMMAGQISKKLSGSQAFRLIINNGSEAGQSVFHLHCHFLSGKIMTD